MPYIPQQDRNDLLLVANRLAENPGELNFQLSQVANGYLSAKTLSYQRLNDVIGALECLKLEIARRIVAPYENHKILENGDVFTCRSKLPKGYI